MSQMYSCNHILLHLTLIAGIGPAAIAKIAAFLDQVGDWQILYTLTVHDLQMQCQLTAPIAQKIVDGLRDIALLEQELALIDKHMVNLITTCDEAYSPLLKHIHLPPPILYVHGACDLLCQQSIALVGSRQANWYGQKVVDALVPGLVAHDFVIVSGGAIGADSMAHQATLNASGSTIAVLGSGLLEPYPVGNKRLFSQIVAQGGALISPFPLRMRAHEGTFPARNRIIAGLSQAVVVIQAAIKSGASITANFALEQGREVAVIPGDIFDPLSAGCHRLAGQGAALVTSSADILELLGLTVKTSVQEQSRSPSTNMSSHSFDPLVHACITPQTFDQLLILTQLNPVQLQEKLFSLTLEGHIHQNVAGLWVIC